MNAKYAFFLLPLLALAGCSPGALLTRFSSDRVVIVPHDPNSLWNIKQGREYASAGRYELAKEHYLMALASSSDEETKRIVIHELQAVDLMIQAQR
ncbi:MAG: hypothetical protein LBJ82_04545 [Deltaproteobacteria bacterium]|jgi:hypothetical protein|nr:hypothetical protein [Deltaproteobacteria bacterium]